MKEQIITFALDYKNSKLTMKQYAVKKGMTTEEAKLIIMCGMELYYPKRLQQKNLIKEILKRFGYSYQELSEKSGIHKSELSETVRMKRGLTERSHKILIRMNR